MADPLKAVETEALKLTPEERVKLADRLISSVFDDHDIEAAWAAEVERRIDDLESGRTELVSAEASIARARAAIK